ncbi:MAG: pseudouridine synthase [Tepidisphaeraceae bacterium]
MKVRIQKLLADAGVESRRHVEEMVLERRITVNGELVKSLPVMVNPETDEIAIDGQPVKFTAESAEKIYVIVNKPKGVYCTNVAQGEQKRAIDLLPPEIDRRLYPVGRLDADSRGLLLLTNDGDLTQKLTHPKFGVAKTYTAVVDGFVRPETIERLSEGVWLADPEKGGFRTSRSFIKVIKKSGKNSVLQITIREGRNRQVRRMLANVGHKVRELTRIKIGPLELGKLKPGGFRVLHKWEVDKLVEAIKPKERPITQKKPKADEAPAKPPRPKASSGDRPRGKPAARPGRPSARSGRPPKRPGGRPKGRGR